MRRLIHLSDLHFGRDRPDLVAALVEQVNDLAPDLVAISGDLTQRARNAQFEAARAFIDALAPPVLSVPGNHDVPLDNLFLRLAMPWRRYRRWIAHDLEPRHGDDEMLVIGINTVNPFVWQHGWFTDRDIEKVRRAFAAVRHRVRVVVVHHPMEHLPGERKRLMRGADAAIDALAACGADIVLSGHLHSWNAGVFAERDGRLGVLQVQAGTGLSTRLRGDENDFNLLSLTPQAVTVQRFVADADGAGFRAERSARFELGVRGWGASGAPE